MATQDDFDNYNFLVELYRLESKRTRGRRPRAEHIERLRSRVNIRELEVLSGLKERALWEYLQLRDPNREWGKYGDRWEGGERNISPTMCAEAAALLGVQPQTIESPLWILLDYENDLSERALEEIASKCKPPDDPYEHPRVELALTAQGLSAEHSSIGLYQIRPSLDSLVSLLVYFRHRALHARTQAVFHIGASIVRVIPSVASLPYFLPDAEPLIDAIVNLFSSLGMLSWPWRLDRERLWTLIRDPQKYREFVPRSCFRIPSIYRTFADQKPPAINIECARTRFLDPIVIFKLVDEDR